MAYRCLTAVNGKAVFPRPFLVLFLSILAPAALLGQTPTFTSPSLIIGARGSPQTHTASGNNTYTQGVNLVNGTLNVTGDQSGGFGSGPLGAGFGSQTGGRYRQGQITIGDQSDGSIAYDSGDVVGGYLKMPGVFNYRLQLIASNGNENFLTYWVRFTHDAGTTLTLSGVKNTLDDDNVDIQGGENWNKMVYKYGGAIGISGSMGNPNGPSPSTAEATEGPWNSFLMFNPGTKFQLLNNEARFGGGVGYYREGNIDWGGSFFDFGPLASLTVSGNKARVDGGGMYFWVNNSNTADSDDRSLYVEMGSNSYFGNNKATASGGAIYADNTKRSVDLLIRGNTFFENNYAGSLGGPSMSIPGGGNTATPVTEKPRGGCGLIPTRGISPFRGILRGARQTPSTWWKTPSCLSRGTTMSILMIPSRAAAAPGDLCGGTP